MPADAFDRFVRQYMDVDFEQFIEPLERKEHDYPDSRELFSVMVEVDKQELLDLLEPESQLEPMPEIELEHEEDVGAWAAIVREWMCESAVNSVSIGEVVDATDLTAVKVWLAGLLDDFDLKRKSKEDKDFYNIENSILRMETVAQREVA
jgi:hypothetical protein